MINKLCSLFKHFVVLAFSAIVLVTLIQVFMRYFMNNPLKWVEEASRYVFVWAVMVSIGIGTVEDAHIALNMITGKLGKKAQLGLYLIGEVIILGLVVVLLVYGTRLAIQNMSVLSPAMKIPLGIAYAGIPVGALVILFFHLVQIGAEFKKFRMGMNTQERGSH